jgi:quercetin dioxygenase-like cupin family protein
MKVVDLGAVNRAVIERYGSARAESARIAAGNGEAHVHLVTFEPGGVIGPHEAGFGQLFLVLDGAGWVAGADGQRIALGPGAVAFIQRGEIHSKGSEEGSTALMIQVRDLELAPAPASNDTER